MKGGYDGQRHYCPPLETVRGLRPGAVDRSEIRKLEKTLDDIGEGIAQLKEEEENHGEH